MVGITQQIFKYTLAPLTVLLWVCVPLYAHAQTPAAPIVTSTTFPDTEAWYPATDGVFSWDVPEDVSRIAVEVLDATTAEPQVPYEPPVSEMTIERDAFSEGEQYLAVQFKNAEGWGTVTYYPIHIDATRPEAFSVTVSDDVQPRLTFAATDALSGILQYEFIAEEEGVVYVVPAASNGAQVRTDWDPGTYHVMATAYDLAGNATSTDVVVTVAGGTGTPTLIGDFSIATFLTERPYFDISQWFTTNHATVTGLFIMLVVLAVVCCEEQYRFRRERARFEKEKAALQKRITQVFTTLRADVFTQLVALEHKRTPRKSKSAAKKRASKKKST